jgi:hypothetical protein
MLNGEQDNGHLDSVLQVEEKIGQVFGVPGC